MKMNRSVASSITTTTTTTTTITTTTTVGNALREQAPASDDAGAVPARREPVFKPCVIPCGWCGGPEDPGVVDEDGDPACTACMARPGPPKTMPRPLFARRIAAEEFAPGSIDWLEREFGDDVVTDADIAAEEGLSDWDLLRIGDYR